MSFYDEEELAAAQQRMREQEQRFNASDEDVAHAVELSRGAPAPILDDVTGEPLQGSPEELAALQERQREASLDRNRSTVSAAPQRALTRAEADQVVAGQQATFAPNERGGWDSSQYGVAPIAETTGRLPDRAQAMQGTAQPMQATGPTDEQLLAAAHGPGAAPVQNRTAGPEPLNANMSGRALAQQVAQAGNEQAALHVQKGENEGAFQERKAALLREDQMNGEIGTEAVRMRQEQAIARREYARSQAYSELQKVQEKLADPPSTSRGRVLQIMGALLSGTGNGGIGAAMGAIGQSMNEDQSEWKNEIAGHSQLHRAYQSIVDQEDTGIESELRQQAQLTALTGANTLNAIKAAEAEYGSEDAKIAAHTLSAHVRQQTADKLIDIGDKLQQHELQQQEILRKQRDAADEDAFHRMGVDELEQKLQKGEIPNASVARSVLEKRRKAESDQVTGAVDLQSKLASLEHTQAGTEKMRREAEQGPPLSDGERKTLRLFEGVAPSVDRLQGILDKGGSVPHPYAEHTPDMLRSASGLEDSAAIKNVSLALLRDESGAALPPAEQEQKIASWGINSGDPDVRKHGLKLMLDEYKARYGMITRAGKGGGGGATPLAPGKGLAPAQHADTVGGVPAADVEAASKALGGGAPVHMVNPETGETRLVAPEFVSAYEAEHFVRGRASPREPSGGEIAFERHRSSADAGVGASY